MSVMLRLYTALVLLFLLAPMLVVVPLSFTSGEVLTLPLPGFSLRWYEDFFTGGRWLSSTRNSLLAGLREFLSPTICAAAVRLTLVSLLLLALHQALLAPRPPPRTEN